MVVAKPEQERLMVEDRVEQLLRQDQLMEKIDVSPVDGENFRTLHRGARPDCSTKSSP